MLELNCWIYNHEFHWLYKRKYISCHKCGRVWAMDASGLNPTGMPHLDLFLLLNPDNPSPPGQSKLLPSSVDRSAPSASPPVPSYPGSPEPVQLALKFP